MKQSFLYFLVAASALGVPGIALAADTNALYKSAPGPFAVETVRYDWHDAKRDRDVPVKIYYPKSGEGPFPVIVFSHGLGGSREGYAYLGDHWASHGYVSGHISGQGGGERDPFFQKFILSSSTAFWDAYLKNDKKAKTWLADGGFEDVIGPDGKFEKKLPGSTK